MNNKTKTNIVIYLGIAAIITWAIGFYRLSM